MENQNLDALKEIKVSFNSSIVKTNLILALEEIKKICNQKEYQVEGSIDAIIQSINLDNSTLSTRKKIARRVYFFQKKKNRKTMSALFSFLRKRILSEDLKITIKPSLLEQQVDALREKYKKLRSETEEARIKFKEAKKLILEKKSVYDN